MSSELLSSYGRDDLSPNAKRDATGKTDRRATVRHLSNLIVADYRLAPII
jgi:hypothetical protein